MKKAVSILLSLILIISAVSLAAEAESSYDPIIYVTGFGSSTLTKDLGTQNEIDVLYPDSKTIAKVAAKVVPDYVAFRVSDDYDKFTDDIIDAVKLLFDDLKCDDNGNSVKNISVKNENIVTPEQPYGKCNFFFYDWRKDVTETADELNGYLNAVLEATGRTKAALLCSSMGCCIGSAYIAEYGYSKLSSITMSSSAAMGVDVLGKLLSGNLDLYYTPIYDYLVSLDLLSKANLSESAIRTINSFGGINTVLSDIATAISEAEDKLFSELVCPFLSKMPGIWSFVKNDMIDECKEKTGIVPGSALEKKIDNYLKGVRPKIVPALKSALSASVKLAIISGYNLEPSPVVGNLSYQSDNLIATADSSFGAVCMNLGKTFSDSYRQVNDDGHYRISPDKTIDASGCAFPENTWFIKDAEHAQFDPRFVYWVAYTGGDVNIYANSKYTQYCSMVGSEYAPMKLELSDILPTYLEDMKTAIIIMFRIIPSIKKMFR